MGIPGGPNPLLMRRAAAAADDAYQIEKSIRFNSGDSPFLQRPVASSGNRSVWTWSGWVKRNKLGATQAVFHGGYDGSNREGLIFLSDDTLAVYWRSGGTTQEQLTTTQLFRDPSAFYHFVWAFD